MTTRNWTYVRMLTPTFTLLDAAVTRLNTEGEFRAFIAERPWFFLRFVDVLGPQLRIRTAFDEHDQTAFIHWAHGWYAELVAAYDDDDLAAVDGPIPGRIGFDVCTYRPEIEKYGSLDAVERIEDLWTRQSPPALELWSPASSRTARVGLWSMVAHDVMRQLFEPTPRTEAVVAHANYWLQSTTPGPTTGDFVARIGELMRRFNAHEPMAQQVAFADDLVVTIEGLAELPDAVTTESYAFNLLHILANRLGLSPVEEGLAMLAVAGFDPTSNALVNA